MGYTNSWDHPKLAAEMFEDSNLHYPPDESRLMINDILCIMIYIYGKHADYQWCYHPLFHLLGNFQLLCLPLLNQIWSWNIHKHHGNPAHHLHVWIRVDLTDPFMDSVCIQQGLDYAEVTGVTWKFEGSSLLQHLLKHGFRSPFLSALIFQGCAYDGGRCCLHVMCRAAQPITATVEVCQTALAYIPYVDGNREALSPSETGPILQSHKKFCPKKIRAEKNGAHLCQVRHVPWRCFRDHTRGPHDVQYMDNQFEKPSNDSHVPLVMTLGTSALLQQHIATLSCAELIDGNPMMVYASHDWQGLLGQTKCDLDETPHVCPNSSDVLQTGDLPHLQKIPGIKQNSSYCAHFLPK